MGSVIDVAQAADGNVGVDLSGHESGMAKQFLHGAEVGAAVEQMGRKRMSQAVRSQ